MYLPMAVEPTKLMAATSGWSRIASTASLSPCTTLKQPSGSPASDSSRASIIGAPGSRSDGLSTKVLPQASAIGNIHIGTIAGKLNGVMPATTPTGWRIEKLSTLPATCGEYSPFSACGMPQANSTTSMPRAISPLASSKVLPCCEEISVASSSRLDLIRSRKLNITCARRAGGVLAHPGSAAAAAATALPTSAALASGTAVMAAPVAGLNTSCWRPLVPAVSAPPM